MMLKSNENTGNSAPAGLARFLRITDMLEALSSLYSSLRMLNTLMKIFSAAGGCKRLNIVKPKNGFATNNSAARQKYILAVLYGRTLKVTLV